MAITSATLERDVLPARLYGHDAVTGFALVPYGTLAPVTIRTDKPVFYVTNTSNSGSGSLRTALEDSAAAGGGRIRILVSGTCTTTSTLYLPANTFIDGRGQRFRLVSTSGAYVMMDAAGNNIIIWNLWISRPINEAASSSDIFRCYAGNGQTGLLINVYINGNIDGLHDITRSGAAGSGWTRVYSHWDNNTSVDPGGRGGIVGDGGSVDGTYSHRYRTTDHHNVINTRQRGPMNQGWLHSYNNAQIWGLYGIGIRNGSAQLLVENSRFDAGEISGSANASRGISILADEGNLGGSASLRHSGSQPVNGATLIGNTGSVFTPAYPYTLCVANDAHYGHLQRTSGQAAQVEFTGGHTLLTATLPTPRAWADGTGWIAAGIRSVRGNTLTGAVARLSSTQITFTPDAGQFLDGDEIWGQWQDSTGEWVTTWNPLYITGTDEGGGGGGGGTPTEPEFRGVLGKGVARGETLSTIGAQVSLAVAATGEGLDSATYIPVGAVILARVSARTSNSTLSITPPAGFTSVGVTVSSGVRRDELFVKTAGALESKTVGTFTAQTNSGSLASVTAGLAVEVRTDIDPADPVDVFGTVAASSLSDQTAAQVTTSGAGAVLYHLVHVAASNRAVTPHAGMDEQHDYDMTGYSLAFTSFGASEVLDVAGATGSRTASIGGGASSYTVLVAFNAAPAAPIQLSLRSRTDTRSAVAITINEPEAPTTYRGVIAKAFVKGETLATVSAQVSLSATAAGTPDDAGADFDAGTYIPAGALILARVSARTSNSTLSVTPPAGFASLGAHIAEGARRDEVFAKKAGATESKSLGAFTAQTNSGSSAWVVAGLAVEVRTDIDPDDPLDAFGTGSGAVSSATHTASQVTAAAADAVLYQYVMVAASNRTGTPDAAMDEEHDHDMTGLSQGFTMHAASEIVAAGATGTRTATLSSSASSYTVLVAFNAAPAAPITLAYGSQTGSRTRVDPAGEPLPPTPTPPEIITASQIEQALSGAHGPIPVRYQWSRRTMNNSFVSTLTGALLQGATPQYSIDNSRAVIRSVRGIELMVSALPVGFDATLDNIAIVEERLIRGQWVAFPLGLYRLQIGDTRYDSSGRAIIECDAADLSVVLTEGGPTAPYTVASGVAYRTAIIDVLEGVGLSHALGALAAVLPTAQTWPPYPETTWWQIVHDLADGVNHLTPWPNAQGAFTWRAQYVTPEESALAAVTYQDGFEPRMIEGREDYRRRTVAGTTPNRVAVLVDDPTHPDYPDYAYWQNADPDSPVSTAHRQERTMEVKWDSSPVSSRAILDLATAADIAKTQLRLAAMQHGQSTLVTLPDPRRGVHEYYRLALTGIEDDTLWRVVSVSRTLDAGGLATHELERVVPVAITEVVP